MGLLPVSARAVTVSVVAKDRRVVGAVIGRVVPCHGRRC